MIVFRYYSRSFDNNNYYLQSKSMAEERTFTKKTNTTQQSALSKKHSITIITTAIQFSWYVLCSAIHLLKFAEKIIDPFLYSNALDFSIQLFDVSGLFSSSRFFPFLMFAAQSISHNHDIFSVNSRSNLKFIKI